MQGRSRLQFGITLKGNSKTLFRRMQELKGPQWYEIPTRDLGSVVSFPRGVRGRAPEAEKFYASECEIFALKLHFSKDLALDSFM